MMEWDSIITIISYDHYIKIGWFSIDMEKDSRWKNIEEWIEEWMIKKYNNIIIKFIINYDKIKWDDMESSNEDKSSGRDIKI